MKAERTLQRLFSTAIFALTSLAFGLEAADHSVVHDRSGNLRTITPPDLSAPRILQHPGARLATIGDMVAWSVMSVGATPFSYQWQFNSNNILLANADTLLLTNISAASFGAYRVIVQNPAGSVTSSNALLQLDSDRDGLADAWETNYFTSITNRSGFEDYDQDGASDRDEFLEGTNPRFSTTSVNPRLMIISDYGEVFATPNQPFYTNLQTVTLTGVPDPGFQFIGYLGGVYLGDLSYLIRTNPAQIRFGGPGMLGSQVIRAFFGLPIPDSLDVTNSWRIDDAGWFGQSKITHDGVDAVQSGRILGAPLALLELNINLTNEGTITFWWKVDGTPANRLQFYRNNRLRSGEIGTNTDWQKRTYYLGSGNNVVQWQYDNRSDEVSEYNGMFEAPADAAWVDEVSYAVWPDPTLDGDSDGMRDIWELRFFDTTDIKPNADEDLDGISNRDEFIDGTDPSSNGSYLPRLTVITSGAGRVTRNPDYAKYTNETVRLEAVPDPDNYFVIWGGAVSGTNTTNSVRMNANRTVTAEFGMPLPIALDTPTLTWTRSGLIGFFGQTNVSSDGVDAAQAGPIERQQESAMETTISGPGTLIFWWKANCTREVNFGRFFINGVEQPEKITGAMDWQPHSVLLPAGNHLLRWNYTNVGAVVSLTNTVWVDRLIFSSSPVPLEITRGPEDLLVPEDGDATFRAGASGTPPFRYQWFRNGVSLGSMGTNSALTLTRVTLAQAGSYSVQVSNGTQTITTRSASLTVVPTPPPNDDFTDRTFITGTNPLLGYTFFASSEFGQPNIAAANGFQSVWWNWIAPAAGMYRLNITATNTSGRFGAAIYTGSLLTNLLEVASGLATNINPGISQLLLPFNAAAGTSYSIGVDENGGGAFFSLSISAAPVERPALVSTVITGDQIAFNMSAPPGANYVVESSNDLQTWTLAASGVVPPSGALNFSDVISRQNTARFYRIRIL